MTNCPFHSSDSVLLHDASANQWLLFEHPFTILQTSAPETVVTTMRAAEDAVATSGRYAAGFVSYEAAPGFDAALAIRPGNTLPLVWLGIYPKPRVVVIPDTVTQFNPANDIWHASISPMTYAQSFAQIKHGIYEGDVYQVNLTYRLRQSFVKNPWSFFLHLIAAQQTSFGAFITTREWTICSASPELFFTLDGTRLLSRPMKGTAPRGLTCEQDHAQASALHASEKNRAENLMIVDMVRNDIGRIATPGSVTVSALFTLEKYPTLWQMTSTVEAHTNASICEIFRALFPPASITGAPKARAMSLIFETETSPRNIYTGTIGFIAPNRRAQFNVAIRTLLVDHIRNQAEYGVGGGVVWDSTCSSEQAECRIKSNILDTCTPTFSLLETLLWTPAEGFALLDRHIARVSASANYFDYTLNRDELGHRLRSFAQSLTNMPHKIRLLISRNGTITLEALPLTAVTTDTSHTISLARHAINRSDPFLYHKTTNRRVYTKALMSRPGDDDVLLWNTEGEITESTRMNVVAELDGVMCTPPVICGLLPGTYRAQMLADGRVTERIITLSDLLRSPRVFLINSVRGMLPVTINH